MLEAGPAPTNYYAVLDVEDAISLADETFLMRVGQRFRTLFRNLHPDVLGEETAENRDRMTELCDAVRVLSNPVSRAKHDAEIRPTIFAASNIEPANALHCFLAAFEPERTRHQTRIDAPTLV